MDQNPAVPSQVAMILINDASRVGINRAVLEPVPFKTSYQDKFTDYIRADRDFTSTTHNPNQAVNKPLLSVIRDNDRLIVAQPIAANRIATLNVPHTPELENKMREAMTLGAPVKIGISTSDKGVSLSVTGHERDLAVNNALLMVSARKQGISHPVIAPTPDKASMTGTVAHINKTPDNKIKSYAQLIGQDKIVHINTQDRPIPDGFKVGAKVTTTLEHGAPTKIRVHEQEQQQELKR